MSYIHVLIKQETNIFIIGTKNSIVNISGRSYLKQEKTLNITCKSGCWKRGVNSLLGCDKSVPAANTMTEWLA